MYTVLLAYLDESYHGEFRPLKRAVRLRSQVFSRGLDAMLSADPSVFLVGVEWNSAVEGMPLHEHRLAALRQLLPLLERHCEEHDHRALIIADEEETSAEEVVSITRLYQGEIRAQGSAPRILDAPLFTPSHWSYGVQGADLVTYVNSRRRFGRRDGKPEDERAQRVLDAWWKKIDARVVERSCSAVPLKVDGRSAWATATGL